VKLCPVCEKFRMGAIKGISISICDECSVEVDEERVTLGDMVRKQQKGDS
jgi:hypothetical protein